MRPDVPVESKQDTRVGEPNEHLETRALGFMSRNLFLRQS